VVLPEILSGCQSLRDLERLANGGERRCLYLGDATKSPTLMTQVRSALELQLFERPTLGAANTPSIHQARGTTGAVTPQPHVGSPDTDPRLSRQNQQR